MLIRDTIPWVGIAIGVWLWGGPCFGQTGHALSFNKDVRPLLAEYCFSCHGPDKGNRKADLRLDIREDALAAGAIDLEKPLESPIWKRIQSKDSEEVMPPKHTHKQLSDGQRQILQTWLQQGAKYELHWSYQPLRRPSTPAGREASVDAWIDEALEAKGIHKMGPADRRILARRLALDLTGLAPTFESVQEFLTDPSPTAYQRYVDRLFASGHYGERMAMGWLDLVRFADTIGYHSDNPRNVWPYRDWVIQSFQSNKPFDRFTVEQIAGDLLQDATQESRVGSAFNRLLLTTEEGGAQPKDYEARMLADRVRAIGTVWLGHTFACAQCHDHKFDPITMKDFYSLGAFFADLDEASIGKREPGMVVAQTQEQTLELERLQARRDALKKEWDGVQTDLHSERIAWESECLNKFDAFDTFYAAQLDPKPDKKDAQRVWDLLKKNPRKESDADFLQSYFGKHAKHSQRSLRLELEKADRELERFQNTLPRCLVSQSTSKPRTVRILPRGNWMDETGELVQPAIPAFLKGSNANTEETQRLTRMDLAQWLVSRDHPLTARVVVNRLWKHFMGTGIAAHLDDPGTQGGSPSHPELLDWLACEFVDSGWNIQHVIRLIVSSDAYQRSSQCDDALWAIDPENRWYERQYRFRVEAEIIRDLSLDAAGLLSHRIGGPSVRPYQPANYWENLNFPTREYEVDVGESQYRRGLYTWWQRSFLHPSLLAFDAPSREECCAERARSNIPQQALVLMNDPTYVEASRGMAHRLLQEKGTFEERLHRAFHWVLQRDPNQDEVAVLTRLWEVQRQSHALREKETQQYLSIGQLKITEDPNELAAWSHIGRVLLNLHEAITRE